MAKQIVKINEAGWSARDQHSAEIERNVSIRIFGLYYGQAFDKTFKIGDYAEYDSYNLSYFGKIVSITDKSVTIEERYGSTPRRHRLKLSQFTWRNYDFDVDAKQAENSNTMNYI